MGWFNRCAIEPIKNAKLKVKKDILPRTFDFGIAIIELVRQLPRETASYVLGRQLLRAGTSIAANVEEAQAGVSRADFSNKIGIALKEARETNLWLRFINKAEVVNSSRIQPLIDESEQIKKILGSICKKVNLGAN